MYDKERSMSGVLAKETFAWKARDVQGREHVGSQIATNEGEVVKQLL